MSEQDWRPRFRHPRSTVTKVLRSPAFEHSREHAAAMVDDAEALRSLTLLVEDLDHSSAPLSTVSDRVAAAVLLLRAMADRVDGGVGQASVEDGSAAASAPGSAARERLVVAALHYLVTPVDLIPDFRAGGYVDDVLLLSWIFGAAAADLEPYLTEDDGRLE